MAAYTNDLRLKEIATGDESGTWGDSTNTNLELIAEAFSFGTEAITTNADTHATTIADGSTDEGRSIYLKYTGTLDSACTITLGPNTVSKLWFIENATSGSQNIIISQGSGANVTIPAGDVKAVYSDGAGSGAAIVDAFASLNVVDLKVEDDLTVTDDATVGGTLGVTGVLTANAGVVIDNITIDGTEIDLSSGDLTIDVAGGINLDSDGGEISFKDAGTEIGKFNNSSSDFSMEATVQDKDILFKGNDGGSGITALTLDMSDAGRASFNNKASFNNAIAIGQETFTGGNTLVDIHGSGSGVGANIAFANDHNTDKFFVGVSGDTSGDALIFNAETSNMIFGTNNAERMRIDSSGNLGVGTTSPQSGIHLAEGGAGNDGGSVLTLSQTGFGSIVNNDDLGSVHFGGVTSGGTGIHNAAKIMVEGDATWANNDYPTRMSFFTTADGASSATERMRIDSNGNLGLGDSSPANFSGYVVASLADSTGAILDFKTTGSEGVFARIQGAVNNGLFITNEQAHPIAFNTNATERMRIDSGGTILFGLTSTTGISNSSGTGNEGAFIQQDGLFVSSISNDNNLILNRKTSNGVQIQFRFNGSNVGSISTNANSLPSDRNFKRDIEDLNIGLDLVTKLNPVSYNYKIDNEGTPKMYGLIAQDLEQSLEEVGVDKNSVQLLQHKTNDNEKESDYSLDYLKLTPILIKAIQEQQEQIETLKSEIKLLKGE